MRLTIFHVKWPIYKHIENSLRGVYYAARHRFSAIDIDILMTKDGVIVACHWDRPQVRDGFHDPHHRVAVHQMVRNTNWVDLKGLRARDGYRIQRIEVMLAACARVHIIAYLEPKDDPRFAADAPWQYIKQIAAKYRTRVRVRALPQNAAALPFARNAGFRTRRI